VPGPVGVATLAPRRMRLDGATVRGGGLFDFVVATAHRSLFPALFLQREIRRQGLPRNDLLFGLPNANPSASCAARATRRSAGRSGACACCVPRAISRAGCRRPSTRWPGRSSIARAWPW
jgi:hypothetical protein